MEEYPLENKIALKNTKRLLNNLVTWCPFFAHVRYLPVFVFPFVKIFQNEPVLCFEALCTILGKSASFVKIYELQILFCS